VNRIAKQVSSEDIVDSNDVAGIEELVRSWQALGEDSPLLHYQAQVIRFFASQLVSQAC
jgi:hypothetical protein